MPFAHIENTQVWLLYLVLGKQLDLGSSLPPSPLYYNLLLS